MSKARDSGKCAKALMTMALRAGILVSLVLGPLWAAEDGQAESLRPARMNVVVSQGMLSSMAKSEAVAAIKAWCDIVGRENGFAIRSDVLDINSPREAAVILQSGDADLLVLDLPDYLPLEREGLALPLLYDLLAGSEDPRNRYLLLVRPDLEAASLAGLRNRSLLIYPRLQSKTARAWLGLALSAEKHQTADSHFASVVSTLRPQDCVLPVYFRKADACIEDQVSFHLLSEMNGQLNTLRTVMTSPRLLERITATPRDPHPFHNELIKAILKLSESACGKQILSIFKSAGHAPADEKYMEETRRFWQQYDQLKASSGKDENP
jgi:hypothetical protein